MAVAALVATTLPWRVSAQDVEFKIGVVHIEDVVEGSPAFERASSEWAAALEERTGAIQLRQRELREAELLLTGADAPTGEERTVLINGIDRLRNQIERMSANTREDLEALRRELLAPIVARVQEVVVAYGKQNGYDVILDTSAIDLALAIEDIEITDEVLEIVRAEDAAPEPAAGPVDEEHP